jgi:hypothetical protein
MGVMTVVTMTHATTDFGKAIWTSLRAFGRGIWNLMESMGKARAAAELARLGYHDAAKRLMLENK